MSRWYLIALLYLLPSVASYAAPMLTAIEPLSSNRQQQQLRIKFDQTPPQPKSFATGQPPRIVLDFNNVGVKLTPNTIGLDGTFIRSATAVQNGKRTRVILNLKQNASYTSQRQGKQLLITVSPNTAVAVPPVAAPTPVSADTNSAKVSIDFHRGSSGEGRVELTLPSATTPTNVRRNGKVLQVEISGAQVDQQRRLDVNDFATPVSKIDTRNQGRNSRIEIQPQGNWDFVSYQAENKLVIEIRKAQPDTASPLTHTTSYKGDKLSLNFQNIEVRTILQVLAEFSGLNIVTSDSVTGSITLRLKDVPWDQALDLILQSKGLDQRRIGNIIQIAPREELLARDKQVQEARQQLATLEPMRSETFVLRYRSAEDFQKILDGNSTTGNKKESLLSERGNVLIDSKTNTLIVNDISANIEKVRDIIRKTDVAVKQVLIEARIVEATDNWSRDLGVRLSYDRLSNSGILTGGGLNNALTNAAGRVGILSSGTQAPYTVAPGVNLPIANPAGSLTALYSAGKSAIIGLELQALQTENQGRVISSPRIMTADRQEATIEQGTEIPYQEATSSGATSTSFKKAVLSLIVKPQITPDNQVMLEIKVNKDSVSNSLTVGGTPALDTKKVNTQVLVENGGTVVIGGIFQQTLSEITNKVPLLGDIPFLGALFRSTQKQDNRSELLVFITPRVVNDFNSNAR